MIDRILKNWKTTIIGILILIVCFTLVFMGKATLTEVSVFLGGGFFILFSKDSMLKNGGNIKIGIFLLICTSLICCKPFLEGSRTTLATRIDTIQRIDTIILSVAIPGDTVYIQEPIIKFDTVLIYKALHNRLTLPPWEATTDYAHAQAGITNNVPWLTLQQGTVKVDSIFYLKQIKILQEKIVAIENTSVRKQAFYKVSWFWIAFFLGLLLVKQYARY